MPMQAEVDIEQLRSDMSRHLAEWREERAEVERLKARLGETDSARLQGWHEVERLTKAIQHAIDLLASMQDQRARLHLERAIEMKA